MSNHVLAIVLAVVMVGYELVFEDWRRRIKTYPPRPWLVKTFGLVFEILVIVLVVKEVF